MKPNYPNIDSPEKINAFLKRVSEMVGGCAVIPQGIMIVPLQYGGNAGHLFHDCRGPVTGFKTLDNGYFEVRGLILPTNEDLNVFRRSAKEGYVSKARIRWTSNREEVIKD